MSCVPFALTKPAGATEGVLVEFAVGVGVIAGVGLAVGCAIGVLVGLGLALGWAVGLLEPVGDGVGVGVGFGRGAAVGFDEGRLEDWTEPFDTALIAPSGWHAAMRATPARATAANRFEAFGGVRIEGM